MEIDKEAETTDNKVARENAFPIITQESDNVELENSDMKCCTPQMVDNLLHKRLMRWKMIFQIAHLHVAQIAFPLAVPMPICFQNNKNKNIFETNSHT
jgi:hypothetical protein